MLHRPKIIFTLKDLELWKDLASFKKCFNAVHCLHTDSFFLYVLNTGSHVHNQRQKWKNKTLADIVLIQFQRGKQTTHILGNMEWNQKEQLQPVPKSSDFLMLKPAQILYILNEWELQKYFFLTLSFIRNGKRRKYATKSKKLLERWFCRHRKTLRRIHLGLLTKVSDGK